MSSIVTSHFKNLASDSFYNHLTDENQKYYFFIGRVTPWENVYEDINGTNVLVSGESRPPYMTNSYFDQIEAWKRMSAAKKIYSSDVSYCIRKKNWASGNVYDEFRDDVYDLGNFYVMTDERHVFKCLHTPKDNNGTKLPSLSKPQKILEFSTRSANDGYVWKYMMTIPQIDLDKFGTNSYIPIRNVDPNTSAENDETEQINVRNLLEDNNVIRAGRVNNLIVTERSTNYISFLYTIDSQIEIGNGSSEATFVSSVPDDVDALNLYLDDPVTMFSESGVRVFNYNDDGTDGDYYVHNMTWKDQNNNTNYNLYLHYFSQENNEIYYYPIDKLKLQKNGINRTIKFVLPAGTTFDRNITSGATVYVGPKVSIKNVSEESKLFFAVPTTEGMERESKFFGYGPINSFRVIYDGEGYYSKHDENGESIIKLDYNLIDTIKATADIVISPYVGHGYNSLDELYANFIMIVQSFEYDENGSIDVSNDFRQIGLWRQPENYDPNAGVLTVARQSALLEMLAPLPSPLLIDALVYLKDANQNIIAWATVIKKDTANKYLYITNLHNLNEFETQANSSGILYYRNINTTDEFEVGKLNDFNNPDLKERTGELLYIENRKPISRAIDQIESVKLIVEF